MHDGWEIDMGRDCGTHDRQRLMRALARRQRRMLLRTAPRRIWDAMTRWLWRGRRYQGIVWHAAKAGIGTR